MTDTGVPAAARTGREGASHSQDGREGSGVVLGACEGCQGTKVGN